MVDPRTVQDLNHAKEVIASQQDVVSRALTDSLNKDEAFRQIIQQWEFNVNQVMILLNEKKVEEGVVEAYNLLLEIATSITTAKSHGLAMLFDMLQPPPPPGMTPAMMSKINTVQVDPANVSLDTEGKISIDIPKEAEPTTNVPTPAPEVKVPDPALT